MKSYRHIIAATDFSDESRPAVSAAGRLAARFGAQLTLLHVVPPAVIAAGTPTMFVAMSAGDDQRAQEEAAASLRELASAVAAGADVQVSTDVAYSGSPGLAIVDRAAELGAELIVLGTHGYSGLERLLIGSVAAKVLRHARCDVLTLPPAGPAPDTEAATVLATTDLSDDADAAMARSAWWANQVGAELHIAHVYDDSIPMAAATGGLATPHAVEPMLRERLQRRQRDILGDTPAELRVLAGRSTADALCRHADEIEAALVVAARHGRGAIERLLVGSVTERLVRHAKRPVLCVMPPRPGV